MNSNSRALIYFLYNKNGNIAEYITYQLKEYRKHCKYILLVVNGKLQKESKEKVNNLVDEILERQNIGMDVGAYKDAINHIGLNKICNFHEVILTNYTCFGPIFPFTRLFDWASKTDCSFWAITPGSKCMEHSGEYLHKNGNPLHYQSYFLALRHNFLISKVFKDFLDALPDNITYEESVNYFEYAFPGYFEKYGFKGAVYCNESDLDYPLLHNPLYLIEKYHIPLIKIRSFFHPYTDTINHDGGLATLFLLDFLSKKANYPLNLIWDYLLREKNLNEIMWACQLNFILPNNINLKKNNSLKAACVFHAFYEDLFEESLTYLSNVKNAGIPILITTTSQEKKNLLTKLCYAKNLLAEIKLVNNRGRDVSALLIGAKEFIQNFDLVLFAHDKKSSQYPFASVGRSWRLRLYENTMGSVQLINNIISQYENQPNLGISFPPPPRHSIFAEGLGNAWTGNFVKTKQLLNSLGIDVNLNENLNCISPLGTCFWFRPSALKIIFDGPGGKGWEYSDFPLEPCRTDNTILHAIERAYCYVSQNAGYYPAVIQSDFMARNEFTNLEFNQTSLVNVRNWINWYTARSCGRALDMPNTLLSVNNNLSIKQNTILLAKSIRRKYPIFWKYLLPLRRSFQLLFNIKTLKK